MENVKSAKSINIVLIAGVILIVVLSIFLGSCQKEDSLSGEKTENKEQPVNITVAEYSSYISEDSLNNNGNIDSLGVRTPDIDSIYIRIESVNINSITTISPYAKANVSYD